MWSPYRRRESVCPLRHKLVRWRGRRTGGRPASIQKRETARGISYDVRLRGPDGRPYKRTFRTRTAAVEFEAAERTARARGDWVDPRAGRTKLAEHADRWLAQRPDLRPRTRELYAGLLRKHIVPRLGAAPIGRLHTSDVRTWQADLLNDGIGRVTAAKAYRLLRAMLATAVQDGLLAKNPCNIRGAGTEHSPERPTASVSQVDALASAVGQRHRALVLLAAYGGLRFGELLALRRDRVDLVEGAVYVTETQHQLGDGRVLFGPPKTEAGRRTVALPTSTPCSPIISIDGRARRRTRS